MYADFTYYKDIYKGTFIPDADIFKWYADKATLFINIKTYERAKDYDEDSKVKDCMCALAEHLYQNGVNEESNNIASEKVGEWTRTYRNTTTKELNYGMTSIVVTYLATTGMLYGGN